MMLLVHGVEHPQEEDAPSTVYGSPLWVARVSDPVPGYYKIGRDDSTESTAVCYWDGHAWETPFWTNDNVQNRLLNSKPPSIPESWLETSPSLDTFESFRRPTDKERRRTLFEPEAGSKKQPKGLKGLLKRFLGNTD